MSVCLKVSDHRGMGSSPVDGKILCVTQNIEPFITTSHHPDVSEVLMQRIEHKFLHSFLIIRKVLLKVRLGKTSIRDSLFYLWTLRTLFHEKQSCNSERHSLGTVRKVDMELVETHPIKK